MAEPKSSNFLQRHWRKGVESILAISVSIDRSHFVVVRPALLTDFMSLGPYEAGVQETKRAQDSDDTTSRVATATPVELMGVDPIILCVHSNFLANKMTSQSGNLQIFRQCRAQFVKESCAGEVQPHHVTETALLVKYVGDPKGDVFTRLLPRGAIFFFV